MILGYNILAVCYTRNYLVIRKNQKRWNSKNQMKLYYNGVAIIYTAYTHITLYCNYLLDNNIFIIGTLLQLFFFF